MHLVAIVLVVVNAIVCLMVAKSDYYTLQQARAQGAIVWPLPLLGAGVVEVFLRSQSAELGARRYCDTPHDNW